MLYIIPQFNHTQIYYCSVAVLVTTACVVLFLNRMNYVGSKLYSTSCLNTEIA